MAITNAQQYQQLVNPPMKGNKRPGYRGDDAYGSGDSVAGGGDQGNVGDRGDGPATNAPSQDRIAEIRQANITLENLRQDKIEEKLEKFRNLNSKSRQFTNFISKFSPIAKITSKFGPLNTRDFFTDKVLGSKNFSDITRDQFADLTEQEKEDMFGDYMSGRMSGATDAYGNPIGNIGNDGVNQILPVDTTFAQAPSITEQEDDYYSGGNPFENRTAYRLMNKGGIADTVVGGEMDFESARQMYGLGKLVKKVTRTVKKIAKSPVGKAALLYAGGAGLSALGAGSAGTGFGLKMFGPQAFASNLGMSLGRIGLGSKFIGPKQPKTLMDLLGGKVGVGILGTSALAGLMTPKTEEEEDEEEFYRGKGLDIAAIRADPYSYLPRRFAAEGGDIEKEPVAKKTMPLLDMDGKEMDLRAEGGFVPIGRMEKADDVPARLSKNEFVFTADAVRNAGDGDVDKGAEVMYNMMKNLESGGDVSEDSQGLEGARKMFQTSQRLEEVL
jgi:curved DNA-binding protein CbpA